jgi:hypothetical protein
MITASVADVVAFESWPTEQQELARRVLRGDTAPSRDKLDEIAEDIRDAEASLYQARNALRDLEQKLK